MYNNQDELILKDFSENEVYLKIIKMYYIILKNNLEHNKKLLGNYKSL